MTTITIDHLTRVEGHGGIHVTVGPEGVESCRMEVFEGARFYEALLEGRHFREVPGIVARVCAICSAGHTLCALMAIEQALGVEPDGETVRFRELLNLGQLIESHALHLFCLVLPDILGYPGVLPMAADHPEAVRTALEIKRVGNLIQEVVGGRAIHPVNMVVGGVGRRPSEDTMRDLAAELRHTLPRVLEMERLLLSCPEPDLGLEPAVYVALRPPGECYGLSGEVLAASGYPDLPVARFRDRVNERVVNHSTAKQSLYAKSPFMVGALARLVHNGERLDGVAGERFRRLMPAHPTPLHNNRAQYVELIWAVERAIRLSENLARGPAPRNGSAPCPPREVVHGEAALEVPRGTLYHAYHIDPRGRVVDADIITPTAQNLANVERDIRASVGHCLGRGAKEAQLQRNLEWLVRAYDPCISCSTHLVQLTMRP